jgi:nitrate reductase gamma subunit
LHEHVIQFCEWPVSLAGIYSFHRRQPLPAHQSDGAGRHPALTIVAFAFHICLILTPIFLLAHVTLIDESWNLSWWTLPDGAAEIMTLIVIAACVFFLVRRLVNPEVQYVTSASDYMILGIVAAPFITGILAYYQWFGYQVFLILHILSGEVMLVAIPFTRLSHMLFAPLTRAYMGSEFGGVEYRTRNIEPQKL